MITLKDGRHQLDEQKDIKRHVARQPERSDFMEIDLPGTENYVKLRVHRFWNTDLGVRVAISLMICWFPEIEDDDCEDSDWIEYGRDTVDLWSAQQREGFTEYCFRRLKQVTTLSRGWNLLLYPYTMDLILLDLNDRIEMSIS